MGRRDIAFLGAMSRRNHTHHALRLHLRRQTRVFGHTFTSMRLHAPFTERRYRTQYESIPSYTGSGAMTRRPGP